jgi:tetratricopeptide (TPR) repeat protein
LELAGILSKHRAENLFQIGVLAREAGNLEIATNHWRQTLHLSPSYAIRIASLLALDLPDEEISLDLFPDDLNSLKSIASGPFSEEKFPKTNGLIWQRMKSIAETIPVQDPSRWQALAEVAAHEGDTETELDCLRQASSKQPMNRTLRLLWANRLAEANYIDEAIEQADFCRTLAPEDTQVLDAIRRWKELRNKIRQ